MFAWESVLVVDSKRCLRPGPRRPIQKERGSRGILTPRSTEIHSRRNRSVELYGGCRCRPVRSRSVAPARRALLVAQLQIHGTAANRIAMKLSRASRRGARLPGPAPTRVARTARYGPVLAAADAGGCGWPRIGGPKRKSMTAIDQGASTWLTVASFVGGIAVAWNCEAPALNE